MADATPLQFALLLGRRAVYLSKSTTAPDEVADVVAASGVDRGKADAIAWGGHADLSPTEIDALAIDFCFHPDLLSALFRPISPQILELILSEVEQAHLDSPRSCDECDIFRARIAEARENGFFGDHTELIFGLLGHLRVSANSALAELAFEDLSYLAGETPVPPLPDWLFDSTPVENEEFDQLAFVFSALDSAARARVLAFAYNEKAEALSKRPLGDFAAFARLRSDHLTAQARQAFDALATSPDGELTLPDLVRKLGLGDGRALGQLERSVNASVQALAAAGYQLSEQPLNVVQLRRGVRRLRLSPEALKAWRSLLAAERESGSSGAHSHAES